MIPAHVCRHFRAIHQPCRAGLEPKTFAHRGVIPCARLRESSEDRSRMCPSFSPVPYVERLAEAVRIDQMLAAVDRDECPTCGRKFVTSTTGAGTLKLCRSCPDVSVRSCKSVGP